MREPVRPKVGELFAESRRVRLTRMPESPLLVDRIHGLDDRGAALAGGMFVESPGLVAVGAWSLFAGVALAALDNVLVISHAVRPRAHSQSSVPGCPAAI